MPEYRHTPGTHFCPVPILPLCLSIRLRLYQHKETSLCYFTLFLPYCTYLTCKIFLKIYKSGYCSLRLQQHMHTKRQMQAFWRTTVSGLSRKRRVKTPRGNPPVNSIQKRISLHAYFGNSSDRALNCYQNAHKTRKECVLAPASLAKLRRAQF